MEWNFNIKECPKSYFVAVKTTDSLGREFEKQKVVEVPVILATSCETVTVSRWLPKEQRWNGLSKFEQPIAWCVFPTHPYKIEVSHD